MRLTGMLVGVVGVWLAMVAGAWAAPPDCQGTVSQTELYSGQGKLESLIVGGGGKLYVSGADGNADPAWIRQYPKPGQDGKTMVTEPEPGAGGLAWDKRQLLWGSGNTAANGTAGDDNPASRLLRVNLVNKTTSVFAEGLGMANGVVRLPNGPIFASNDMGTKLDRITRKGVVNHGWAELDSANGMVVTRDGKFIFAAQTLVNPPSIARIPIKNPANITTWFEADSSAVFDGLAMDGNGNLYVAAWLRNEVWKIDTKRKACVLAKGIGQVSNVAFGRSKQRFGQGGLYAVGFQGQIVRINGARKATVPAS